MMRFEVKYDSQNPERSLTEIIDAVDFVEALRMADTQLAALIDHNFFGRRALVSCIKSNDMEKEEL